MSIFGEAVLETSTTTGTGTYSLAGAVQGFQTFVAAIGTGNVCAYFVRGEYSGIDEFEWEAGIGTVTDATPDTLTRDSILDSSNGGAAVNWGAGTKSVMIVPNAAVLNSILTMHAGTSRPSWLPTNGIWLDNTSDPRLLKWYDGGTDIPLLSLNAGSNICDGIYLGGTGAANLLGDYEEGTWTPEFDFATTGDLSVSYATQWGIYRKIGTVCIVGFNCVASTFTHTTASGSFRLKTLPFSCINTSNAGFSCTPRTRYIFLSGKTTLSAIIAAAGSQVTFEFTDVATTGGPVTAGTTEVPTGNAVSCKGTLVYLTD